MKQLDYPSPVKELRVQETEALYNKVAASLSSDQIVTRIRNEVKAHYASLRDGILEGNSAFFYAVEAPSGSGKTLLPFALAAAGMPVRQFTLHPPEESQQEIYKVHLARSETLRQALKNDLEENSRLGAECTVLALYVGNTYRNLQTVAVLSRMLGLDATPDLHSLKDQVAQAKQDLPLIVVDEVLSGSVSADEKTKLKFLRNILRGAGVVSMFMGTNANIDEFLSQVSVSRCSGSARLWCRVIARLPSTTPASLEALDVTPQLIRLRRAHEKVSDFLEEQCLTCNPLFAELCGKAVAALNDADYMADGVPLASTEVLDAILRHMAEGVYLRKRSLRTLAGIRAQLSMHFDAHRLLDEGEGPTVNPDNILQDGLNSALIGCHFAILTKEPKDLFLSGDLVVQHGSSARWLPCTAFPPLRRDSFMFMALSQTVSYSHPPYWLSTKQSATTTAGALQLSLQWERELRRPAAMELQSTNAQSRSGDRLEGLAAAVVVNASHCSGVSGCNLADFILSLVRELIDDEQAASALQWDADGLPGAWIDDSEFIIPFLSAANDKWPASLMSIPGVNVANYERPKNSAKCDGYTTDYSPVVLGRVRTRALVIECKNYEAPVTLKVIKEILSRVMDKSFLHVVMVSKLQSKYWTKGEKNWATFRDDHIADAAVVRIVAKPGRIACKLLSPQCANIEKANCGRIVVFIEYETLNGH